MNPLYNLGIHLFAGGVKVASLRSAKIAKMLRGQRDTAARIAAMPRRPGQHLVWIHASSLGEFEQGRPLIEMIKRNSPDSLICLSFFSPSGFEVRHDYPLADAVVYLPLDTPRRVKRFLDALRPDMAVFVKYEFWGNYLDQLRRRGIPTYLISAIFRPGQIFFRPWGGMFRRMLGTFTHLFVQDDRSVKLLSDVGIHNVTRVGDTRIDRVNAIKSQSAPVDLGQFGANASMRMVIGSSWPADEAVYIPWLNAHPDVTAIIAPHEFDPQRLAILRDSIDGDVALLSELDPSQASGLKAIIVDSFGKLASLYRYADVAYVGGGFGAGIHNINEAAVYGIPVVFGPRHDKFKEAADLIARGAAFSVDSSHSLDSTLHRLLSDPEARFTAGQASADYIAENLGATEAIHAHIFHRQ